MKKKFNESSYDRVNSTYVQIIYFENGKHIVGYSKKVGHLEAVDPIYCLTNFILRMYRDGYLRPSPKVTPVECIVYELNQPRRGWIVTCYYDRYDISPDWISDKILVKWLSDFYRDIRNNKSLDYILEKYGRRGRSERSLVLNPNKITFTNLNHLLDYVEKLLDSRRYSPGEIKHFYIQCRQKFVEDATIDNCDHMVNVLVELYSSKR